MKRGIVFFLLVIILSGCDDIKDIWIVYRFTPHHGFGIENRSGKDLYCESMSSDISVKNEMDGAFWGDYFLFRTLYKDKNNGLQLDILYDQTILHSRFFQARLEDLVPTEEGFIAFLEICYIDDLKAVYNGERETVPFWVYSYTLEDLQRYNWNVPFPDESGTLKIEQFEYTVKDYTGMTYDDIMGNY